MMLSAAEDVSIELRDLGPLVTGRIDLRPMTVLVGPNNSGKSTAAMLLWALHHVVSTLSDATRALREPLSPSSQAGLAREARGRRSLWHETNEALRTWLGLYGYGDEFTDDGLPDEDVIAVALGGSLMRSLQQALGVVDIARWGSAAPICRLRTHRFDGTFTGAGLTITHLEGAEPGEGDEAAATGLHERSANRLRRMLAVERACHALATPPLYLPASRSGFMRARRLISTAIMRSVGRPASQTRVGYLESDFLARLVEIDPEQPGALAETAGDIERMLLDGRIVTRETPAGFADFHYEQEGSSIPLERASSGVTEVAPLILFVRYLLSPGDVLIIEEPEAHLHPALQRKVACALARLVHAGVRVVMTTHGDVILEQLSHLVQRSVISPERTGAHLPAAEDALSPDEISVHVTQPVEGGFEMVALPVDAEDGIRTDEMSDVYLALHEQLVALEDALAEEEAGR